MYITWGVPLITTVQLVDIIMGVCWHSMCCTVCPIAVLGPPCMVHMYIGRLCSTKALLASTLYGCWTINLKLFREWEEVLMGAWLPGTPQNAHVCDPCY